MSLQFPDPIHSRYVGHLSPDVAEYEIDSLYDWDADGTAAVLAVTVGTLDDGQWEFVGVEAPYRCPTWLEMKQVRDMCFDAEDCCFQLHPPASRYVNSSEFALWIWRPTGCAIPQPPLWRELSAG